MCKGKVGLVLILLLSTVQIAAEPGPMTGTPSYDTPSCNCMSGLPDTESPESDPDIPDDAFPPIAEPNFSFTLQVPPHKDPGGPIEYRWKIYFDKELIDTTPWTNSPVTQFVGTELSEYCFAHEVRDRYGNVSLISPQQCATAMPEPSVLLGFVAGSIFLLVKLKLSSKNSDKLG